MQEITLRSTYQSLIINLVPQPQSPWALPYSQPNIMRATAGSPHHVLKRLYSTRHKNKSEIEQLLRESSNNARQQKISSFNAKDDHQLLLLKNNHFFTSHVLPQKQLPQGPITKEYAFLLPNGVCIYQPMPTTKVSSYTPSAQWDKLVCQYEHLGWQVLGESGQFLVLERLKNSRQDSLKRVKQSAKKYGIGWVVLTTGIFIGGWIYGV